MSSDGPVLPTRLGRAGWTDHEVRGVRLFDLDPSRTDVIDLLLLAVGGPPASDQMRAVVALCAQAVLNVDPRIPPMKLVRLGAAYGETVSGLATGYAAMAGSLLGMWSPRDAAVVLTELDREVGPDPGEPELRAAIERRIGSGRILHGFGVPGRAEDERVRWLRGRLDAVAGPSRPMWRLFERASRVLAETGRLPNVSSAIAAALIDVGCDPWQVGALSCFVCLPPLLANALEGAMQAPPILQRLPSECVVYAGAPERPSPRTVQSDS